MPQHPVATDLVTLCIGGAAAVGASAVLARRIERVGGRTHISEALLGLAAALGADSPEITSSITALHSGDHAVGVGVVLGSNVFNLAALLGLGSLVAGRIALHRRVIALEGAVALALVLLVLLLASGVIGTGTALAVSLCAFLPYCAVIATRAGSLAKMPVGRRAAAWLASAVREEDLELGPLPNVTGGRAAGDVVTIAASLAAVVAASVAMEHAGVSIGAHYRIGAAVVGGVLLAAITSLPNVVAAVYLARRGRGAAVLSEAMNSNALNVIVGLLLPGVLIGIGPHPEALGVAWWYGGLTAGALVLAYVASGIGRRAGALISAAYVAFVLSLVLA